MYLSRFLFASVEAEEQYLNYVRRTCYSSQYPFGILTKHNLRQIDFEPVTILYGGNGCGKSTALNIICEKLGLLRDTVYNRSDFYEEYLKFCNYKTLKQIPRESRLITSDDVFDYMINIRCINNGIDMKRAELFEDYLDNKFSDFKFTSLDDYEKLKKVNSARSKTQSRYTRENLVDNVREYSNGESAFIYFEERIKENALYLLDEPENSLAPKKQLELLRLLEDSVRFYKCQFVIATHSPFLLSMRDAKIYDFDENPVDVKRWTELESVREYYRLFKEHACEF